MSEVEDRFWAKVKKTDGCWLWTKSLRGGGYGQFVIRHGVRTEAHRFAWELENGPIPDGKWVLHHCDTPACANPAHLYLGTVADNVRDCIRRGRARMPPLHKGEKHPRARLTWEAVTAIRWLYHSGLYTLQDLADRYGIANGHVSKIVLFRIWIPNHAAHD